MAIFRCFLLSCRRSLPCSKLLSSFSLVNPFSPPSTPNPLIPITNPTVLTSSLISRFAISIYLPHGSLFLSHPYISRSDPPHPSNCNPKLVNSDFDPDSETLIKRECEKEQPSLLEMVKRSSHKGVTPEELGHFREKKKKERVRECNMIDKGKLPPPPFDPFKKGPPSLHEIFKRTRSSQLGMAPEGLELFWKEKGTATEVDFRNARIEVMKNPKHALREFHRMLADGVAPNANTYALLIKKLGDDGDEGMLKEAKKSSLEMVEKGMKPSVKTYTDMFEVLVKGGKEAEAREIVEMMKGKGFDFDEKGVRELLKWKINAGYGSARDVISVLFGK